MEARFGLADRVWVMDRGMMSQENIAWLQKTGRKYVLGASRREIRRWRQQIVEENGWQSVREGVDAKLARDGVEAFVLCQSGERQHKEKAMHERFALHIEQGLERLARRIHKARRKLDRRFLERQIGRLLERNSRAVRRYLAVSSRTKAYLQAEVGLVYPAHSKALGETGPESRRASRKRTRGAPWQRTRRARPAQQDLQSRRRASTH
jgi:hypothetical protein